MLNPDRLVEYGGKLYSRVFNRGYILLRPVINGVIDESTSVSEHRLAYEIATGIELGDDMVVHHLNRDRSDNRPCNLIALSRRDHAKLHAFEDNGDGSCLIDGKVLPPYRTDKKDLSSADKKLSSLVAYNNEIYVRKKKNGYYTLFPLIDGKIDYSGEIAEHRLIYELHNGVELTSDMHVHHINHDKLDNHPENLVAMTRSEHTKQHALDSGYHVEDNYCVDCGSKIGWKSKRCGPCNQAYRRKVNGRKEPPNKCELEELIQTRSNTDIAREYGVSGTAVKKWRQNYGLSSANEQHGWKRGRKANDGVNTTQQECA